MQLFYSTDIKDNRLTLDEEESKHCMQVLRKRVGDLITVVDGKGSFYEAVIEQTTKKSCICLIRRIWKDIPIPFHVHIAIAPTKNMNRIEWFLEKAVEIGVQQITPILCRHAERKVLRSDRLEKILLAAMKQSQHANLPDLEPLTAFEDFIVRESGRPGQKFIAYIDENVNSHLQENYVPGQDVCILIGPEGGFSPVETTLAFQRGFTPVSLGNYRLRTETAGLVACHTINLMNWKLLNK